MSILDPTGDARATERMLAVAHDRILKHFITYRADELFVNARFVHEVALYFFFFFILLVVIVT